MRLWWIRCSGRGKRLWFFFFFGTEMELSLGFGVWGSILDGVGVAADGECVGLDEVRSPLKRLGLEGIG